MTILWQAFFFTLLVTSELTAAVRVDGTALLEKPGDVRVSILTSTSPHLTSTSVNAPNQQLSKPRLPAPRIHVSTVQTQSQEMTPPIWRPPSASIPSSAHSINLVGHSINGAGLLKDDVAVDEALEKLAVAIRTIPRGQRTRHRVLQALNDLVDAQRSLMPQSVGTSVSPSSLRLSRSLQAKLQTNLLVSTTMSPMMTVFVVLLIFLVILPSFLGIYASVN